MKNWLSLKIAKNLGVCANIDFIFPENFFYFAANFFLKEEKIK